MGSKDGSTNQVLDMRDRLLREAQQALSAQQRGGLPPTEAAQYRYTSLLSGARRETAAVQTDPVIIEDRVASLGTQSFALGTHSLGPQVFDRSTAYDPTGAGGRSPVRTQSLAASTPWTPLDDAAQAEALQIIQLLASQRSGASDSEVHLQQLEVQLAAEQQSREDTKLQLSQENHRLAAAQEQVLCLERELDEKEMELQVTEKELDQTERELQQVMLQLQTMKDEERALYSPQLLQNNNQLLEEDVRYKAMRVRLLERERQLELKDQHIARLQAVMR
mmetsp:Transcript_6648/g.14505  ORF Transcript_6648/g.14505 Transcript_6648/m.14505 type:complete len:278 (-) Transcript_6648:47-880(-)|eukprot:CAMPEP_0178415708 /NCGR_PEP_ID=MMETSP0689_2-20121128/23689_1 /TAXON_ID=160604 /ORGANISM="Amphidinium massartii, Strain CS-259" /LENGTH=277 /DNA_ID=CAMNT_0020037033 /DNA_START=5 /DNA_END=838 /DNA_ORIENTATION=-